ncbi:hypothetical protein [Parapedobacter koreensis]|uniref:CarboxypepD_reg-like domain-containing protein n=1 Tax=Parapedobacter koreensis TaxID=332977 RepID=A0A1H7SRD0_9SPHI|nr:hypothetical protein [Parapedobacter koreensis]SEL75182.1 hypothetical protein SAMN05421740_109149 [Parapedobacter koreensis]
MTIASFFGRSLLKWLLIVACVMEASVCDAQNYLMNDIAINDSSNQRVGDLLDRISHNQAFYFAYNSNTVAVDSVVNVPNYRGTLIGFLERIFGSDYEFKETPGYVIIRYAPGAMKLILRVEKERGRPLVIAGQIRDANNDNGIYLASIYERNVLVSTLSGPTGNFKLTIKRPDETIWLTISKENYRDTTIALLPPVQVGSKHKERRYWLFSADGHGDGLDGTAFGRFFTNSKQRIQRINLGGFLAYNPYQISLMPGLSSQGLFNSQVVNQVSLNIVGGHTAGVNGVEVGGVFNINQQHAHYFQAAGLFNLVGSDVRGVQLAGALNRVVRDVAGLQVAGVSNQSGNVKGMQLSGIFNVAESLRGVQVAGAVNVADSIKGFQLAGLVNVAGKVAGVQFAALVNVADSSDYPLGIINLIKNGRKSIAIGIDESSMAHVAFRSGGRRLYGLVGGGHYMDSSPMKYALEVGLGIHIVQHEWFLLDAEAVNRISTNFKTDSEDQSSIRLLPQLGIGRHWGIIAGPTINYTNRESNSLSNPINGWKWYHNSKTGQTIHLGIVSGIRYQW